MCEAKIIKKEAQKEVILAEEIAYIKIISADRFLVRTVFGEERYISGAIAEIDLAGHKVVLVSE